MKNILFNIYKYLLIFSVFFHAEYGYADKISRSIYRATAESADEAIRDSNGTSGYSESYSTKKTHFYDLNQAPKKNFMVGIYTNYNDLTQNNFDNIHAQVGYRLFSDFYGVFQFNRDFTESNIGFAILF